MKEKSIEANLSQIYSNHCMRATSMTLLDRAGIPLQRIRNGHRNKGRVKVYCEGQKLQQKQCFEVLAAPFASSYIHFLCLKFSHAFTGEEKAMRLFSREIPHHTHNVSKLKTQQNALESFFVEISGSN